MSVSAMVGEDLVLGGITNAKEAPDSSPQAKVGELAPTTRMGDGPVVADTSNHVDEKRDEEDEPKDAARADTTRLVRLDLCTGMYGSRFEKVGALVGVGANKGYCRLRADWIAVADEGDGRRLAADRLVVVVRHLFGGIRALEGLGAVGVAERTALII